jgi:hypothetical protein
MGQPRTPLCSFQIRKGPFNQKLAMYLLDCEDFYSITLEINLKNLVSKLASELTENGPIKVLTAELIWMNLNPSQTMVLKDSICTLDSIIKEDFLQDYFSERRFLVFKNRLILLKLLLDGEAGLGEAHAALVELNLKEAENFVSQQNLVVVCLLLNRRGETDFLINRAKSIENVNLNN